MGRRRNRENWLTYEVGGAPVWMMIGVALVIAAVAWFALTRPPEPEYVAQPRETPSETPSPTSTAEPIPVAVFIGDSFTEGGSAGVEGGGFAFLTGEAMGWDAVVLGEGGTGYIADGPDEFPDRAPIPDRADGVVDLAPDVVVVAAGINDSSLEIEAGEVYAAASDTFATLTSGLTDATVYVVGPFWPNGHPNEAVLAVRDEVQAAASDAGLDFIDPIAEGWITGLADKTDGGNNIEYIGDDGTHPTAAGHAYIADRLAADIEALQG